MRNKQKRLLASFTAIALAASLLSGSVLAAQAETVTPGPDPAAAAAQDDTAPPEESRNESQGAPQGAPQTGPEQPTAQPGGEQTPVNDPATDPAPATQPDGEQPAADPGAGAQTAPAPETTPPPAPAPAEVPGAEPTPAADPTDAPPAPEASAAPAAPAGPAVELTQTVEGITVTARAAEGVFPQGVTMRVTPLAQDDDVAAALNESNVEYDGFFALDVSFYDGETEIEPQSGAVQVSFELAADLLPADADPATLAVQHLVEDEAGSVVEAVTVADADAASEVPGTVEVKQAEAVVAAEFAVESFSVFVINYKVSYWGGQFTHKLMIHQVDEEGKPIGGNEEIVKESFNGWVPIKDYAEEIPGYEYLWARANTDTGPKMTEIHFNAGGDESDYWEYRDGENGTGTRLEFDLSILSQQKTYHVYLIYEHEGGDPTPQPIQGLTNHKTAVAKGDGTYNLNLTVSGAIASVENPMPVDVIYVLDVSTSMERHINHEGGALPENRRIAYATNAIKTLTGSLSHNDTINARYSLVTFGTNGQIQQGWTGYANELYSSLPSGVEEDQGTNYQDGLLKAKDLLKDVRPGAAIAVVFVSDGNPSNYNDSTQPDGVGGNGSSYDEKAMQLAQIEAVSMEMDYFFTVGVGPERNYGKLEYLTDPQKDPGSPSYEDADVIMPDSVITGNYTGKNETDLNSAFNAIEGQLTQLLCTNVTMTDQLSSNVEMVPDANGRVQLKLEITNKDGTVHYGPAESITVPATENNPETTLQPVYDEESRTITLSCGADYKLEPGWTYTVTAHIQPSDAAYSAYRQDKTYPDTADPNTGTHSGESGFFSNTSAAVSYTFLGDEKSAEYPNPVVQLSNASLTIKKVFEGLAEPDLTAAQNAVRFKVMQGDIVIAENIPLTAQGDTYAAKVETLQPGKAYTVTETNNGEQALGGRYTVTTSWGNTTDTSYNYTPTANQEGEVTVTNTYTPTLRYLTITKTVKGNMGDANKAFTFTLTVPKGTVVSETTGLTPGGSSDGGDQDQYTFTLSHGKTIEIALPHGIAYTVTETNEEYQTTIQLNNDPETNKATYTYSDILTEDTQIAFTNTKEVPPPTGHSANRAPYLMMLALGLAAGAWLVLGRRRTE